MPKPSVEDTLRLAQQTLERRYKVLRVTSECLKRSYRQLEESVQALSATTQPDRVSVTSAIANGTFFAGCVEKRPNEVRDEALADAALQSCHAAWGRESLTS